MTMEKIIETQELLEKLKLLQPGIANKDFIESTTHYFFTGTHIITYNDKICISVPFEIDSKPFSIKAVDFYKVIQGIKEETFNYNIDDNAFLIKAKKTKAKIKINTEDFMLKEMFDKLDIPSKKPTALKDPKSFKKGMNLCKYSTSQSAHDIILFCVYFAPDMIASTDNYRVSIYNIKEKIKPFLLPVTVIDELAKFEFEAIHVGDNWVYFFCEDEVVFAARRIAGEFKDVKGAVKSANVISTINLPESLPYVLKDLEAMAKEDEKIVFFSIKKNSMSIKAEKELGWLMKKIDIEYDGENLSFHINMSFLFRIVTRLQEMKVCEDRILFEMDNFIHMISLHDNDEETEKDIDDE